jgi:pimeloyl-ACP methyl ester carboxylesterase
VTRTRWTPLAVLLVAVVLGACGANDSATASKQSEPRGEATGSAGADDGSLSWAACADRVASLAGLECATLPVPLDPANSDGETIELAVARSESTGSEQERIGSLVLNPGGPGGSGIEFLTNAAAAFPESLTDRFDLVSFDPRGVGESTPVRCIDDATKDEQLTGDLSPDTDAELDAALEDQEEFLDGCRENSGALLEHMSTADVAADMDVLREALGDDQLTYLGYSYGTSIGAVYATLFPDNVRAMVLDGSVSPSASEEQQLLAQARGFERTFDNFVASCDAEPECALAPDAAGAVAAARQQLETSPVEVETESGTRVLGPDLFDLAVATALYDTTLWGSLAASIADLDDGGASTLLSLVDRQTGRQPDGSYDNSSDAQTMVACADSPERPTVDEATESARRILDAAPTFGGITAFGALGCAGWPLAANPLPEITGADAPTVLVVGTVGDPATPYEWSEEMTAALESAVLLTYEGDGHTAFLRGGPCIEDAVVEYLVDLVVPPAGTRCPAQDTEAGFTSIRDEVLSQFEEAGIPSEIADCVVDGIIEELGEAEFTRLILSGDQERLTRLVTAQAMQCAADGGLGGGD